MVVTEGEQNRERRRDGCKTKLGLGDPQSRGTWKVPKRLKVSSASSGSSSRAILVVALLQKSWIKGEVETETACR